MGDSGAPPFLTGGPEINFRLRDVDPPSRVYIARDDLLHVTITTRTDTFPVTVNLRLLKPNGQIIPNQWEVIPQGGMLSSVATFQLAEGFLLSVAATMLPLQGVRGDAFVIVELIRASNPFYIPNQVLIMGYLTARQNLSWPDSPVLAPYDQRGLLRSITGTDPAAGVEISETVPTGVMWRLSGFTFVFVSDATATNRTAALIIDDGANALYRIPPVAVQAASISGIYTFGDGLNPLSVSTFQTIATPRELILLSGWRIRTSTANLQAGDNYGAPQINVEEWPVGI